MKIITEQREMIKRIDIAGVLPIKMLSLLCKEKCMHLYIMYFLPIIESFLARMS